MRHRRRKGGQGPSMWRRGRDWHPRAVLQRQRHGEPQRKRMPERSECRAWPLSDTKAPSASSTLSLSATQRPMQPCSNACSNQIPKLSARQLSLYRVLDGLADLDLATGIRAGQLPHRWRARSPLKVPGDFVRKELLIGVSEAVRPRDSQRVLLRPAGCRRITPISNQYHAGAKTGGNCHESAPCLTGPRQPMRAASGKSACQAI